MSFTITNIPAIMRSNKWFKGATLMESWFSSNVNVAPKYGFPDTTTIAMDSWVLTFPRAKIVYDQLIKDRIWQNEPARLEIAKMLRKKKLLLPMMCFDLPFGDLSLPVQTQDDDYINQRVLGMSSDLDDMNAALGNFVFNVVISGRVSCSGKDSVYRVEIKEVGVYVKDSYDFNGDQFLGYWDDSDNSVSMWNALSGTGVSNQDFRDWRSQNGKGGDFRVFSDVKRTSLSLADVFFIK
ncbi:MAG: DUF6402 family protein [Proteobacteria bacterium]|nr:DUF6402 family protein [Pseudomonadota bacterium]